MEQCGGKLSRSELDKLLYKPDIAQNTLNAQRFLSHREPLLDLVTFGSGPDHNPLGKWVSSKAQDPTRCGENLLISMPPLLDPYLLAHLNAIKAFEFENAENVTKLVTIYFEKVNSVIPLVDEERFMEDYNRNKYSIPLLHAITLAACRHPDAKGSLGSERDTRTFAAITSRKVQALLDAEIETDSLALVQIYALLSIHAEGPDGFQQAAKSKSLAIHYAEVLGIQLENSNENVDRFATRLWKSIWILDVLLISLSSTAMSSHCRDVAESVMSDNGDSNYDLLCECRKLERIIDFYRPNSKMDIPLDILQGPPPPDDGSPKCALMMLIYYVYLILGFKKVLPSGYTAERIADILISTSFNIIELVSSRDLPPLPIVPCAVSLTLTVFLRYFAMDQARPGWKRACDLLEIFKTVWSAADVMHDLCFSLFTKLEAECVNNDRQNALLIDPQVIELFGDGLTSGFLEQQGLFAELDLDSSASLEF